MNEEMTERAKRLAKELKRLLEKNLSIDPSLVDKTATRIRAIMGEIHQMGMIATWEVEMNTETLAIEADVTLWGPKKDMSPEEQKIYDEWFKKVNGMI